MRLMIDVLCSCAVSERQLGRYDRLSLPELPTTCVTIPIHVDGVVYSLLISRFTFSTRKHGPTNCHPPALVPCDGRQYLGHWCAPASTILVPRCARGNLGSGGSSGQQREGHGYRPKAQSDHREARLTVCRCGVSGYD